MNKTITSLGFRAIMSASAIALALAVTTSIAQAQQTTSSIRGQVLDSVGVPVNNASVTVQDTRTNRASRAQTNADGAFTIPSLSVGGPYIVTIEAAGEQTQRVEDIFLSVGGITNLTFDLESGQGATDCDRHRNTLSFAGASRYRSK